MCGIAGLYDFTRSIVTDQIEAELGLMTTALSRRGPDSGGSWIDPDVRMGLGHRRLSIIDLSDAGHQPMISTSGRYVIVFNGEIYNFRALKEELESTGWIFRGGSDTEVLLAAIEKWGIEAAIRKCNGMFALALWDRKERVLSLIRDRVGKKPLYFGIIGSRLLFCSELKALHAVGGLPLEIDRDSLGLFMRFNYVPSPWSIYRNIYKLPPGHMASFPVEIMGSHDSSRLFDFIKPFWQAKEVAERGAREELSGSESEVVDLLDRALTQAVTDRMISDVPLGAFLSGGIDSSLVVAMMAKQAVGETRTFTIGYHEKTHNEAEHAKAIAAYLGTKHTELYLSPDDALEIIPQLPIIYDEPFSDSSQIPTIQVSKLARRDVTVALSGDGGDELFFGYARYYESRAIRNKIHSIPAFARPMIAGVMRAIPESALDLVSCAMRQLDGAGNVSGHRIRRLADLLAIKNEADLYEWLISHWKPGYDLDDLVIGAKKRRRFFDCYEIPQGRMCFEDWMMLHDQVTYLPENNLVKVDRASMAQALEVRSPMLDQHVVELAWKIPLSLKDRDGKGKYILQQLLSRYLPRELFDRPKQGFAVPVADWLRGPLKSWGGDLLAEDRLRDQGFLNPQSVRRKWDEHQSGSFDWHPRLWNVLMFQMWLEHWHGK